MVILLKTASVRVSSIQIMQVRVQSKGKSVWRSRYDGDVSGHWCASVLNKQFLTPFRNGIWNHRQVSVGDRGSFPHDPETVGHMET